ncbi:cell wall hydrolase [Ruminococcus sp.]|uniref:cell wall hydrolase n=1 Tax=Ruminococcus sp. TaxID=41978 RepID=UPI0025CF90C1|nr:cell wall hydrolase [Ruminococcus sp.]MCR4637811.1 cell wall hydrolase [Ruminococcus sp.]
MGNLKAAALACGVVASVLGGGIGVAYLTSSTVSTSDIVSAEGPVANAMSAVSNTASELSVMTEKATANKRTTTKKSYTVEKSTAASKKTAAQEGTTSLYGIEVATTAAQISRSVPAPAHAPAAITQPATQASTTAAIVARATEAVKATTAKPVVTTTLMTTTTATTTTTMVETTIAAEDYVEPTTEAQQEPTETYVEPETEPVVIDVETEEDSLPITDEEYVLLCNAVAHEAGCNWISTEDKAKVVEVIMNRVSSPKFPNTIYGVITQPYQFSGSSTYANLNTYSSHVTQSVKDAVTLYFMENGSFTQGYIGFWGDGYSNHFY